MEGLLSTGPTPSSFMAFSLDRYYIKLNLPGQFIKVGSSCKKQAPADIMEITTETISPVTYHHKTDFQCSSRSEIGQQLFLKSSV